MNPKALGFLVAGVILLGALFVFFKPEGAPAPAPAVPADPAAAAAPVAVPPPPAPKVFELVVRGGKLAAGPGVLKVLEGDEVVLRITADKADDLHLHGYDLHLKLAPGVTGELRFAATRTGRFEYELHKAHADLGALEVHPR